jgi:hypothetical protein
MSRATAAAWRRFGLCWGARRHSHRQCMRPGARLGRRRLAQVMDRDDTATAIA